MSNHVTLKPLGSPPNATKESDYRVQAPNVTPDDVSGRCPLAPVSAFDSYEREGTGPG